MCLSVKVFPKDEERTEGQLDIPGGVALALLVAGALLVPTEGARAGWTSPLVAAGVAMAVSGLAGLTLRQLTAGYPFIPREFLRNGRYLVLAAISFSAMAANLAPLIGLPILLAVAYRLPPLEIGLVMVPGAIASSVFGIIAGRITDRKDPRLPIWAGSPLMIVAVVGLSAYAGSPVWVLAVFTGILGAGFGLINTPLAATISRIVSGPMLASALSIEIAKAVFGTRHLVKRDGFAAQATCFFRADSQGLDTTRDLLAGLANGLDSFPGN